MLTVEKDGIKIYGQKKKKKYIIYKSRAVQQSRKRKYS